VQGALLLCRGLGWSSQEQNTQEQRPQRLRSQVRGYVGLGLG
jgi:hypothetical protein